MQDLQSDEDDEDSEDNDDDMDSDAERPAHTHLTHHQRRLAASCVDEFLQNSELKVNVEGSSMDVDLSFLQDSVMTIGVEITSSTLMQQHDRTWSLKRENKDKNRVISDIIEQYARSSICKKHDGTTSGNITAELSRE